MVLMDFSIYPIDKGISLSPYVARCIDVIERSGLRYELHAMGTLIEGEFDAVMGVVRQCFEVLRSDCDRVVGSLKFDYRKGANNAIREKVASVERHRQTPAPSA
jgi:uncharacterized protein (TIGR00106 family)